MSEQRSFFPVNVPIVVDGILAGMNVDSRGITIREHFAGLALQGLLADSEVRFLVNEPEQSHTEMLAAYSVKCSDALLAALAK
jgi:hypothetical protein